MKPKFIVLEGIDGSGTTSQARHLASFLSPLNAIYECEPTGSNIGRIIRTALSGEWKISPRTMALLFAADRQDHVGSIRDSIESGLTVICDRYALSSWAYQGMDLPLLWVKQINAEILIPDLMILLDVDPEIAANRRAARDDQPEIFDVPRTQRILAQRYRELLPSWPGRVAIVDASHPFHEVADEIRKLVNALDDGQTSASP